MSGSPWSSARSTDASVGVGNVALALIASRLMIPDTGTQTSVASSVSHQVALAANANRKGATFTNDDANIARLLFAAGTSSATNYSVQVPANGMVALERGEYTGAVGVIWDADGTGSLRITEYT